MLTRGLEFPVRKRIFVVCAVANTLVLKAIVHQFMGVIVENVAMAGRERLTTSKLTVTSKYNVNDLNNQI